jgi:hypothetical protein
MAKPQAVQIDVEFKIQGMEDQDREVLSNVIEQFTSALNDCCCSKNLHLLGGAVCLAGAAIKSHDNQKQNEVAEEMLRLVNKFD